jgi:hypothetical protein
MNRIELHKKKKKKKKKKKRPWNQNDQCMNRHEPQKMPKFGEESCFLPYRDAKSKNRPKI